MHRTDSMDQYRCLVKHFFGRFFDLESIAAPQVERNVLLVQVFALMVLPGAMRSLFLFVKYGWYKWRPIAERNLATLDDKCFFLSLSMILLGLIAVFEWETLFPDRKDYLILTHLPIRTQTLFLAKISAIGLFLLAFTVAINLCPTFLFPLGFWPEERPSSSVSSMSLVMRSACSCAALLFFWPQFRCREFSWHCSPAGLRFGSRHMFAFSFFFCFFARCFLFWGFHPP